ncbi:hypothetical protein, partial [Lactococcus lactis]
MKHWKNINLIILKILLFLFKKKEIRRFGTSFGWKFQYDFNITYDLFNRVKTFALDSFLIAEQREDEEALEKILT